MGWEDDYGRRVGKDLVGQLWSAWRYLPGFSLERLRKSTLLVSVVRNPVKIRNTSLKFVLDWHNVDVNEIDIWVSKWRLNSWIVVKPTSDPRYSISTRHTIYCPLTVFTSQNLLSLDCLHVTKSTVPWLFTHHKIYCPLTVYTSHNLLCLDYLYVTQSTVPTVYMSHNLLSLDCTRHKIYCPLTVYAPQIYCPLTVYTHYPSFLG
jgi:hypothetical protein